MKRPEEAGYRDYVTTRMDVMRRTAYLLCRDWHLADDLVSITIGKLYRHWPRARRVEYLDAYVRRILVRTWLDEKARAWRREEPVETLPEPPVLPPDDVVERVGLLELLDALPPRRRAAVAARRAVPAGRRARRRRRARRPAGTARRAAAAAPGRGGAALLLRPFGRGDGRNPRVLARDREEPDGARARRAARARRREPELMEGP
ncbi:RNA polymerase sigma-70 factor [Amycolatopsis vancoresmycina DSM 44592]|uniref:RNA polymerase sigma-70 factor n=1 Tax=Amycolatopsis vancoresmycina DSM 44592 TaxID=1292037 RepID=R1HPE7_9PSEU|nr:RNA polymerase sigma-70 factor [Amycolatopsis vancoresmycina DSM 44592]